MSYNFYDTYINSLAKSPKESWREQQQEAINDFWTNTSTIETVYGQKQVGSFNYKPESIQLNSVINPTTGENFGDRYRKIIYKNYERAKVEKWLGKMYKIDNESWLTINTNTIVGANQSAILQKCNNKLKWINKNGILNEWECVFSRNISNTGLDYGVEGMPQVDGDSKILVQLNEYTKTINFNQRFLFNGHAFQVKQIDNHYSDTLMTIYIFETQLQPNDDIENNIAGGKEMVNNSENKILPNVTKITLDKTEIFNVYNYNNGAKTNDTFEITATGTSANNYELIVIDNNNFSIKNKKQSTTPLKVTCKNERTEDIVSIELILGGAW